VRQIRQRDVFAKVRAEPMLLVYGRQPSPLTSAAPVAGSITRQMLTRIRATPALSMLFVMTSLQNMAGWWRR
jgi:hypothetical protein